MAVEAVRLAEVLGAGMKGMALTLRVATVTTVPQTVQLAPFKMRSSTKVHWLRDSGPNDSAGALSVMSIAADGKSITFTPASTGELGLVLVGDVDEQ